MATVSNTIQLRDRMTPVLRSIIKAMQSTVSALAEVDGISNSTFNRMRNDVLAASNALDDFSNGPLDDIPGQTQQVQNGFARWQSAIITANQALQLVQQGMQKISQYLDWASTMTDQQSRLKLITDEQTDIYQLQEMITQSAMRTRSSYESTADSVISMYRSLSGYGATLSQSVRLAEILNKQLGAAGVKGSAQESVMYNLTQSLAAGKLRWEDWRIISSNAGGMVANLAKAAGVTSAQFNQMVQDGEITAAKFAELLMKTAEGAEGIDKVFEEMPDTFNDWMTNIKTFLSGEFLSEGGLGDKINEIFASDGWIETVNLVKGIIASLFSWISSQANKVSKMIQSRGFQSFLNTLTRIGAIIGWLIGLAVSFGTAIIENWSWIEPIVTGIVIAILAYNTALLVLNTAQSISNFLQGINTLRTSAHAAALMMQTGATFGATVAQHGFNAALLACPLTWVVLAIIAVIAVMGIVIGIINQATGSTITLSGVIGGILMSVLAALGNIVIAIWNIVTELIITLWNLIADFVNFFANVWNDPLGSVVRLFTGVFDAILSIVESVAGAIGSLFGQDWSSAIAGFRADMNNAVQEQFGTGVEVVPKFDKKSWGVDFIDYGEAWNAGYQIGEDIEKSISNAFGADIDMDAVNDSLAEANNLANQGLNLADGEGVSVKGSVEIDEDTISLLKDVAEVEWVNKYTTLRPELNVSFGDVHETADTEGILAAMEDMIVEAYASALVGEG